MFVDEENKTTVLKIYVCAPTTVAERYVDVVAQKLGNAVERRNDSGGEQVLVLPISLGALRGYKTEVHLYACKFPSTPTGRLLVLKASDGVIIAAGNAAQEDVVAAAAETKKNAEQHGYAWAELAKAIVAFGAAAPGFDADPLKGIVVTTCEEDGTRAMDAVKAVTTQVLTRKKA